LVDIPKQYGKITMLKILMRLLQFIINVFETLKQFSIVYLPQ